MKKNSLNLLFLYALLAFLPAMLLLTYLFIMKLSGASVSPIPVVSDEMFWYHQITAMLESGMPLGYYGYNGTHAVHGTFGPWGIAILIPYALWGKLFGWGFYSMCIANTTFLGIALFFFALCCRLTKSEFVYTALAYCALLMNLFYSVFSMAEALRWSMAIILTGCILRIHRGYAGKFFKYIAVPVLLICFTEAYMLLALFILAYLMLVLPIKTIWKRLFVSGSITAILAYILRKLLYQIASPYRQPVQQSLTELIKGKITATFDILYELTPMGLWANRSSSNGFPSLFLLFYVILLVILLVLLIQNRSTQEWPGYLFAGYLMLGAIGGYCLIYREPSVWTICRGFNTAFSCAVLILALYRKKRYLAFSLLCLAVMLPSFYFMSKDSLNRRHLSNEQLVLCQNSKTEFAKLFDISPDNSRWDNTIALYGSRKAGDQTALSLAMPESAGYNCMLKTDLISEARYAVVYNSFKKKRYAEIIQMLQDDGYTISFEHDALTILARN